MNVAVLSVTRDRLAYTQHCFSTLKENAGCDYDHYVFDNGSDDGTWEWLLTTEDYELDVIGTEENAGISPALNYLLDNVPLDRYDVIVKVDNDCELLTPNTLRDVCERAADNNAILSPHIRGLRSTPQPIARAADITVTAVVGGIFAAVPAWVFENGYRHPIIPTLDGEDAILCQWFRQQGGFCGYVDWYEANHYRTTDGQHQDYPEYFARREAEREATRAMVTC